MFRLTYRRDVPQTDGSTMALGFDDGFVQIDDDTVMVRAAITKVAVPVGSMTMLYRRQAGTADARRRLICRRQRATEQEAMASSRSAARERQAAPDEQGLDEVDAASAASMDASDPPAHGGITGVGSSAGADNGRLQRISDRAHELWQAAGCPDGRALEFWLAAEREVDATPAG